MKKSIFIICFLLLFSFVLEAQLSFKEKRQLARSYNAGVEQIYSQDHSASIISFTKCLDLDKDYAMAYMQRGRSYAALGDMEEALSDLNMAITSDANMG